MQLRFNWIAIQVFNLEESIAFYRDALGLPLAESGEDDAVFLTPDGFKIELLMGGLRSVAPRIWGGVNARLPGFEAHDLPAVAEQLETRGVNFITSIVTDGAGRHAYFIDPDGNQWLLYESGQFEEAK